MKISEKEVIKYFDIVISKIENPYLFAVNNILIENGNFNPASENDMEYLKNLLSRINSFGVNQKYFKYENINAKNNWLCLTEKGHDLRDFGKGHIEFVKSIRKPKIPIDRKVYLFLFFIFGLFEFAQVYWLSPSAESIDVLKLRLDSLNHRFEVLNQGFDSLNAFQHNNYETEKIKQEIKLMSP